MSNEYKDWLLDHYAEILLDKKILYNVTKYEFIIDGVLITGYDALNNIHKYIVYKDGKVVNEDGIVVIDNIED